MAHEWMTYEELAALGKTSKNAARVLAQRRKWKRELGNDGRTRVLVDTDALKIGHALYKPATSTTQSAPDCAPPSAPSAMEDRHKAEIERLTAVHRHAVELLVERIDSAEIRAERMEDMLRDMLEHQRRPWWQRWFLR